MDPIRVPRIRENYHRVPGIRENQVPRIREIGSLTFSLKKKLVSGFLCHDQKTDSLPFRRKTTSPTFFLRDLTVFLMKWT